MMRRTLGHSGLEVSPLCLGGNVFGWTVDRTTAFRLLDAWTDAGMNFVDTADSYSRWVPGNAGGESERMIGEWFAASGKRHRIVLATKVGSDLGDGCKGLSAAYIARAVDASLRRLRTDCIDLYQSHWDDTETPLAETLEAYARLIAAGKVRAIGASNLTPKRLQQALHTSHAQGLPRYESLQPHYNLCERAIYEGALQRICVDSAVGVIPYYSLASGFLSGKYRGRADAGLSRRGPQAVRYFDAGGAGLLEVLHDVAAEHRAAPAQVALAWLAAQPGVTAPIVSATTPEQMAQLAGSTSLMLSPQAIDALRRASDAMQSHTMRESA